MRRRAAIQTIIGIPAAAAATPAAAQTTKPESSETPKTPVTGPDAVADPVSHFFSKEEAAAMTALAEIIWPAAGDIPGAKECGAVEFLDFLISQSPDDRKQLYRQGLAALDADARKRFGRAFSALAASDADAVLSPLRAPWTYEGPKDPLGRFLTAVKPDLIEATLNSRDYTVAVSQRRRGAGGQNTFWYAIE
jgi:hypothetical protein